MKLRKPPKGATWFLDQFGPASEDESELGDLVEQYQRGHGSIWYWRQVLAIVYGELYQQFRKYKRQFIGGLIRTWCLAGGLHFAAGVFLVLQHGLFHSYPQHESMTASGFPLLTLRIETVWFYHPSARWDVSVFSIALNILLPLLIGRLIATSSDINPRSLLLAYATSFTIANLIWTAESLRMLLDKEHNAAGFLITNLIAMPLVPALLLIGGIGGMRGLSPLSLKR